MHLINDTLYCLLLLSRHVQHGMLEGLCFSSKKSYTTELRCLTVKSYFSVRQYLATVGFFFLFTLSLAQSGGL